MRRLRGDWRESAAAFAGILVPSVLIGSPAQAVVSSEVTRGSTRLVAVLPAGFAVRSASLRT